MYYLLTVKFRNSVSDMEFSFLSMSAAINKAEDLTRAGMLELGYGGIKYILRGSDIDHCTITEEEGAVKKDAETS